MRNAIPIYVCRAPSQRLTIKISLVFLSGDPDESNQETTYLSKENPGRKPASLRAVQLIKEV